MKSTVFRRPNDILDKLVKAGVELVHARDGALGAALDVPPPSLEPVSTTTIWASEELRGLAYRGARKVYRSLKRIGPLQPLLEKARGIVRPRL